MSARLDVTRRVQDSLDVLMREATTTLELCNLAEGRILDLASGLIRERLRLRAECEEQRFRSAPNGGFYFGADLYQLRFTEHATRCDLLQVVVKRVLRDKALDTLRQQVTIPVHGNGRYSTISFRLDQRLGYLEDRLAVDLQTHFSAGYRWLEAHARDDLLQLTRGLATALYVDVRSELDPALADLVALYVIDGEGAYYMLDPRAVEGALDSTAARRGANSESSIELAALFATQLLPPDETVSEAALREGRSLEVPLAQSQYLYSGLQLAEQAFFDTMHLVAKPLVCEDAVRLAACYPSDADAQIGPRLDRVARQMSATVRSAAKVRRRRRYDHKSNHNDRIDRVAKVAGTFGGSFAGAYTETLK